MSPTQTSDPPPPTMKRPAPKRIEELEALAERQGVKPLRDLADLRSSAWPEGENVDDFLAARKEWRRQETELPR